MRVSLKWLSEFVEVGAPEDLARRLTAVGLEVEAVEPLGQGLEGVVAARILSSERHPDAEKLSVTTVDRGDGIGLQVVCGARNYQVGDVVPLATVGAVLPGGQRIERARLRGVESFGMLCSARELRIDEDASGLLILPPEVRPGTPVAQALGLDDVMLEVNVTPNRPDALSHLGIAREVAALLGQRVRMPAPRLSESGPPASSLVRVRIEAPERCARYAARVIEGVRIGPSPAWLARRLEACGVRSIANAVDATNYVLLELGHPLHAFDLDRVAGAEIVVRTARPGETIATLDGKERALEPDDLLIADRDRGSALAGVMGGRDSEISSGTTRVLLESAWFQPSGIRRTSRRQGLQSEASYRFERGADPGMVIPALDRCAALIAELCGGAVRAGAVDAHPRPARAAEVRLRWSRPAQVLGMEVRMQEARAILQGLGFQERRGDGEGATFAVPSWRVDVEREEDLIEELVRFQGYDAIPETLPASPAGLTPAEPAEAAAQTRLRGALEAAGFCEAVNFSFVAPGDLDKVGAPKPLLLKNPISAEMAAMRTSLLPSLLQNLSRNLRRGNEGARLYELARVYRPRPAGGDVPAEEELRLGAVLFGRRHPHGWASPMDTEEGRVRPRDPELDFYDARAAVEAMGEALGFRLGFGPPPAPVPWLHPRSACAVRSPGGALLGSLGELHPRAAAAFELPRQVLALELSAQALLAEARLVPAHRPVSSFPAVTRDLAIEIDAAVPASAVERAVAEVAAGAPVEEWTLFDVYSGGELGRRGRKSVAVYLRYRAPDRTLTDAEVDQLHARVVERLRTDPEVRGVLRA
jgi:phenylalanyl-tRNA synthetase beta chain